MAPATDDLQKSWNSFEGLPCLRERCSTGSDRLSTRERMALMPNRLNACRTVVTARGKPYRAELTVLSSLPHRAGSALMRPSISCKLQAGWLAFSSTCKAIAGGVGSGGLSTMRARSAALASSVRSPGRGPPTAEGARRLVRERGNGREDNGGISKYSKTATNEHRLDSTVAHILAVVKGMRTSRLLALHAGPRDGQMLQESAQNGVGAAAGA